SVLPETTRWEPAAWLSLRLMHLFLLLDCHCCKELLLWTSCLTGTGWSRLPILHHLSVILISTGARLLFTTGWRGSMRCLHITCTRVRVRRRDFTAFSSTRGR